MSRYIVTDADVSGDDDDDDLEDEGEDGGEDMGGFIDDEEEEGEMEEGARPAPSSLERGFSDYFGRNIPDQAAQAYVQQQLGRREARSSVQRANIMREVTSEAGSDDEMDEGEGEGEDRNIPAYNDIAGALTDDLDVEDLHSRFIEVRDYWMHQKGVLDEDLAADNEPSLFQFVNFAVRVFCHYLAENNMARTWDDAMANRDTALVDNFYGERLRQVVQLVELMRRAGMVKDDNTPPPVAATGANSAWLDNDSGGGGEIPFAPARYFADLDQCMCIMRSCHQVLYNATEGVRLVTSDSGTVTHHNTVWPKYVPFASTEQEYSDHQRLQLEAMCELSLRGCRRKGTLVYIPVINTNGQFCYSFTEMCSVEEFVCKITGPDVRHDMWLLATSKQSNDTYLVRRLCESNNAMFPEIKADRHIFAFRNAIYDAMSDRLHYYDDGKLSSNVVACNYIDKVVDRAALDEMGGASACTPGDLQRLTPVFESLMEYQEFSPGVRRWKMAYMGKMLYDLNEMDRWQITLFLYGVAGTGKSTWCYIASQFYDPEDVGLMTGSMERTFGLATVGADKHIFLCPEVMQQFALSQSDFNVLVEGGRIKMATKFKMAKDTVWRAPGMWAGNVPMPFQNAHGNLRRRLSVVGYKKAVVNRIANLPDLLREELPYIMMRCNKAYRGVIEEFGVQADPWEIMNALDGEYFNEQASCLQAENDPLTAFVGNGELDFGDNLYVPEQIFKERFMKFCERNGIKKPRWNTGMTAPVFAERKLVTVTAAMPYPPSNTAPESEPRKFVTGCDFNCVE